MMPINPCYDIVNKRDCPNRCVDCHSSCEKWQNYVKERDVEYERRRVDNNYSVGLEDSHNKYLSYIRRRKQRYKV